MLSRSLPCDPFPICIPLFFEEKGDLMFKLYNMISDDNENNTVCDI